jgi:hypothetical protein
MNETTIILLSALAFAFIVFLSLFLERKVEKKRKEMIKKSKLNMTGINKYLNEDSFEDTKGLSANKPSSPDDEK